MNFFEKYAINYWLGYTFMPISLRLKPLIETGFRSIELYWTDEYQEINGEKHEVARTCLEQGLRISCLHTSFNKSKLLWNDSLGGQELLNEYIQTIIDANNYGCKNIVLHLDGTGNYSIFKKRIDFLLDLASEYDINLCAENLIENDNLDYICRNTKMWLCCDIGHYNIRPSIEIEKNINRIKYVHLHDNFGTIDSHSLPGEGNTKYSLSPISEILKLPCEKLLEVHPSAKNPTSVQDYIFYLNQIKTITMNFGSLS